MWSRGDNQEVGLEAAILERVRNSSLVKWFCADNVAGLKRTAEAVDNDMVLCWRQELECWCVVGVGERPARGEAWRVTSGGLCGSENAGMSNESAVRIRSAD